MFDVDGLMFSQTKLQSIGNAKTTGDCSPAVTGSNNSFHFSNCGIGKEQGKQIIALLNQLLAKHDVETVIKKLDELEKRNQSKLTRHYI
jgi:hypothetical protein